MKKATKGKKSKVGARKAPPKRRRARRRRAHYERRTFMFDPETDLDSSRIQEGLRAPTASEAMRFAVRKMAELMAHVAQGGKVYVDFGKSRRPIEIDIPAANLAAAAAAGG